jgi:hypothetical protein
VPTILGSPECLKHDETLSAMAVAIEPFQEYIRDLAQGKFDAYLDSVWPKDKPKGWGFIRNPILLLHGLGRYPDHQRINQLFVDGTVYVELNSCGGD